jgi:serine/threonine protein kinase
MSANALPKSFTCPGCDALLYVFMPKCMFCGACIDRPDGSRAATSLADAALDGTTSAVMHRDPLLGVMVGSSYVIEKCVGQGGMGLVYRARQPSSGRYYAVKTLRRAFAADRRMRQCFTQEAEALARLAHPNLPSLVEFGETADGTMYLIMPYIVGKNAAAVIADEGPLPTARIVSLMKQLCSGLAHAHGLGVVHCDVKPTNIILSQHGNRETAHLMDFGLAFVQSETEEDPRSDGFVLATPRYMAPEQAGGLHLDHRVDLFALGLVLYELLAGEPPFSGDPLEVATMNCLITPPSIAERRAGLLVNQSLEAMAMRLMAKKPEHRYQSADEVLKELEVLEHRVYAGMQERAPSVTARPALTAPELPPPCHDASLASDPHAPAPQRPGRAVMWAVAMSFMAILLGTALGVHHRPAQHARSGEAHEPLWAATSTSIALDELVVDLVAKTNDQPSDEPQRDLEMQPVYRLVGDTRERPAAGCAGLAHPILDRRLTVSTAAVWIALIPCE